MTIRDIANAVGVTPTTVSNVINGNYKKVSQKTIDKVQKVIKETGYIPNKNARALVKNSSKIIGVIFPKTIEGFMQNPFHSQILTGIEKVISAKEYYLMIKSIDTYEDMYQLMQNWSVDGFVILSLIGYQLPKLEKFKDVPVVFIDTYYEELKYINIGSEDYEGEYNAADYLLEMGHESIGFISYHIDYPSVISMRLNGFKDALKNKGIPFNHSNDVLEIEEINFDDAECSNRILDFVKNKTGICVSADILAIEIMEVLKDNGYSIPDDISIIGFDNVYLSKLVNPKLTTINQDIIEKGNIAAEKLINMIEKKNNKEPNIKIPTNLVIRDSVKKINQ
ncbi:LacI family transcriptional regulator [Vallitalea longa]|uniref:LacI family transcriptional regulator n=1 Tax=Vallitalea longa TaxID=2936439 RepID=A0A9W5Y9B1_9FIRM|nr:LacI family transcriptional regulator [Vallitalea longa]